VFACGRVVAVSSFTEVSHVTSIVHSRTMFTFVKTLVWVGMQWITRPAVCVGFHAV
jgi:hypothetical protein